MNCHQTLTPLWPIEPFEFEPRNHLTDADYKSFEEKVRNSVVG